MFYVFKIGEEYFKFQPSDNLTKKYARLHREE